MTPGPNELTFVAQERVRASCVALSREAFEELYPHPLLWVTLPPGMSPPASPALAPAESFRQTLVEDSVEADAAAAAAFINKVGLIKKRPNSLFPNMISLGRAEDNDLVVALGTISKLHAYFLVSEEKWSLTDWTSTNGTKCDMEPLTPRQGLSLESGASLSFGKEFTARFMFPGHLYDELRAGRTPRTPTAEGRGEG